MSTTKNETSPALQVLAEITKIPAEFLLKEDAVMLNVPSVLKAMEEFAEASVNRLTNMVEVKVSLDNSIPADTTETETEPENGLDEFTFMIMHRVEDDEYDYGDVDDILKLWGHQCFNAGERARDHYYHDKNSDETRKKIGYVFYNEYLEHLKLKK